MMRRLVFVCLGNRNRSPFAEFFFSRLIRERDQKFVSQISITSAGFIPQTMKEEMAALQIDFPSPLYGRPIARSTQVVLRQERIAVPEEWRTRALTPELIKKADMIIVVLSEQKKELIGLYPGAAAKIYTIREISQWDGYLSWEDTVFRKRIPLDNNYWDYVEENQEHTSIGLSEMKRMLLMAYPGTMDKLGLRHAE